MVVVDSCLFVCCKSTVEVEVQAAVAKRATLSERPLQHLNLEPHSLRLVDPSPQDLLTYGVLSILYIWEAFISRARGMSLTPPGGLHRAGHCDGPVETNAGGR